MLNFVDTHCHLNVNDFDSDFDQVLERAHQNGIQTILVPGFDLDSSRKAVELSEKYVEIYAAVGIHPNTADQWNEESEKEIIQLCKTHKVVAIGEIGLDFYHNTVSPEIQNVALIEQLNIAADRNLPVLLHSRRAVKELISCLFQYFNAANSIPIKGIFHAFEGDLEETNEIIRSGFYLGVAGHLTFKRNESLRKIIESVPVNSIVLETDAPYLSPEPHRGERNEPANIIKIASICSQIMNLNMEELSSITTYNAGNLFHWSTTGE